MKHSGNKLRIAIAFSAVVFAAGLTVPSANADEWNKRTVLTVNETIQVQDTVLPPGSYVMKLLDSQSDRHVVQIFNPRENHIYATILAIPKERLTPTGSTVFTFYETPAGTARAMKDWYYPGDLIGQEFRYPKHPYQLTVAVAAPPQVAPETAPPEAQPETTPEAPQPQAEIAPPEQPAPPAEQPQAEQPAPAPAELPKTSSPYPLFALAGLVFLSLGGMLRLRFSR